ncbi:undecaprenyl-diphosphate phosphatase [bacterium]|nr:undecaprenyl-diphosphate phosphatase [bacterium]
MFSLILLAILQGIAEFLPISSSGHLVLGKTLLGISEGDATIEIFLHFGTLLAIIVFYRRRLWAIVCALFNRKFRDENFKLALFVVWASIPAGIVGFLWEDEIEKLFSSPLLASSMLIITAAILLSTIFAGNRQNFRWNYLSTMLIGVAQAFAILPGISRSGSTIAMALWLGANSDDAAEFSFILAIPALTGAAAIKARDMISAKILPPPELYLATVISAIVGYFALALLIPILKRRKLWLFGIYCAFVGILGIILIHFR